MAGLPVDSLEILKVNILTGSGAPTQLALPGSIYINTTGTSTVTHLYVNNGSTVGVASTSWVAVVTVAT